MTERPGPRQPVYANPIQAPGTDESHWRAWDGWEKLPVVRLPGSGRVVVVAAHPDDEVLGAGGVIAMLAEAGVSVTVVSVTDGERSHEAGRSVTPGRLADIRAAELRDALAELGAGEAAVVRLKVPDTEVAFHEDAVIADLGNLLRGARLCLAPWIGDIHGDHEAAGRSALAACREADVPCLMYPVWMWHWARPDDPRVPWSSARRILLTETARARKRTAAERFTSQIRPLGPDPEDAAVLPPGELAHHLRDIEVVFA
ncbi:PIG-L deacetylase family protein [Actinacidiphila sp. ITFR-21]|uniref:PIG-L deacetylase family protein n=1 Tax=Actinacidiphila sp. ITFR-21 TaxID=3075199 RepID=UPI00288B7432|nr:PIG-L family deacetylase [Streptomyces sp. ITFR-21]WNI19028.1 PIG-L family deacetylase [Streptomyces sp. ITFR-21]